MPPKKHFFSVIVLALTSLNCYPYDYSNWTLVWSDEFDYEGLPDPQKWSYDVGGNGWGNNELQYYTQDTLKNARVEKGRLIIEAHREAMGSNNYTSARLVTKEKGDWLYGRIEVRAKLPKGRGTWPAIWMLPTDWEYGNWPNSGEIDIMEHVGYDMDHIHGTVHTESFNHTLGTQVGTSIISSGVDQKFNIYSLEWRPGRIDVFLNDTHYFSFPNDHQGSTASWPFDKRFHLILNIAIGGNWGGIEGVDDSIFPQQMEVDYVRVYTFTDSEPTKTHKIPGALPVAQYQTQTGIRIEETEDVGDGLNLGYIQKGDSVSYKIETQTNSEFDVVLRYASPTGSTAVNVSIDGTTVLQSELFESTGGWQTWRTQNIGSIALEAGEHLIDFEFTEAIVDDLNINRITLFSPTDSVHKFLNPSNGAYFFTGFQQEARQVLMNLPQWRYQGTSFAVEFGPTNQNLPVYRFLNKRSGSHFYTASEDEKNNVIANLSENFTYEGVAFYVQPNPTGIDLITQQSRQYFPIYRCFLPGTSSHYFTGNSEEVSYINDYVPNEIMKVEGIAWYSETILEN